MTIYTVHAPKPRVGDGPADPMDAVFVKDGFCWPALFFAAIWLIYRRMWLVLVLYLVAMGLLSYGLSRFDENVSGIVMLMVQILFALEANNLRRWTLERRGHAMVGVAEGRNLEEAEIRYFSGVEATHPQIAAEPVPPIPPVPPTPPVPPMPPRVWPKPPPSTPVVGLFPAPAGKGST